MNKKACIVQISLFLIFIGSIFLLNLFLPAKEFSEVENKYLKQMPKFTWNDFIFGSFTTDFEEYASDQFVLRDNWIALKAAAELATGKGENNDVYYCSDGSLITRFNAPDTDNILKKAEYINTFAEKSKLPVYVGIIPGSAEIWRDKLPDNAPNDSQKALIDTLYSALNTQTIDFFTLLSDHKDEYIFYHTDHHWTSLGAYYGYTAIMDALGMEANAAEHYTVKTVSDQFLGTTYSSSGFTWVKPDSIQTYVQPSSKLHILNYSSGQPTETPLYDSSYLEKKDKYSMFFGGITPLLEIETGNVDLPSLLIIRDSYMDSLSPFLLEYFSHISIIDLRYYNGNITEYAQEHDLDMALICYSAANFSSDMNLYKLAR